MKFENGKEERRVHIYRLKESDPDYLLSSTDRAEREVLGLPYKSFDTAWKPFGPEAQAAGVKVADRLKTLVKEVDTWPADTTSLYKKPQWPFQYYAPPKLQAEIAAAPKKKANKPSQASSPSKKVDEKPPKAETETKVTEDTNDSDDAEEVQSEEVYQEAVAKDPPLGADPASKKPGPGKLNKIAATEIAVGENKEQAPVETWRDYLYKQTCTLL